MGVRSQLRTDPLKLALDLVRSGEETARRQRAQRRVAMYRDDWLPDLEAEAGRVFRSSEVRQRVLPFLKYGLSQSLLKRVVDEISRPVYSPPPTRKVSGVATDSTAWRVLSEQCRLDEKMDLACRLMNACNTAWLFPRWNDRLGLLLDVLTPSQVSVIPDHDDHLRPLAVIYDHTAWHSGRWIPAWVYWDDEETFRFTADGQVVPYPDGTIVGTHGLGRLPFVAVHRRERWDRPHDETTGADLENGQLGLGIIMALVHKLHRDQGEKQIVITADDLDSVPRGQVIDGGGAIVASGGATIATLDLATDPRHYLTTCDAVTARVAANYGLSLDRINSRTIDTGEDVGLLERRAETVRVMYRAELDLFELIRLVSRWSPWAISDQASLAVDFAELSAKGDRAKVLDIWTREISMGLRSVYDCVRELSPEVTTDEEAQAEIVRNAESKAWFVDLYRRLNVRTDASLDEPGQSARDNGAMGSAVRDGAMSRDEAAHAATGADSHDDAPLAVIYDPTR
jgi:hypothetical protein